MRVGAERAFPQAVADKNLRNEPRAVIVGIEDAAQLWLHVEHRKIIRGDKEQADTRRPRRAGEIIFIKPRWGNVLENAGVLEILPFGLRHS